ncbi:ATP-binding cassette domain-containing protein [Dactylosporangium sp. NPDC005572]|uniref:ABC transporter ATP-binding protein n=1 Tax=Dactylosporangium sp. NPDC005572 TaxID=3156889 RepID=UPI0033A51357
MTIIEVAHLTQRFGATLALDDVSLTVHEGRTVGIVGESGSGKSTLVRAVLGLQRPDSGTLHVLGRPVDMGRRMPRDLRRAVQLVPQDPKHTLNPARTVRSSLWFHMAAQGIPRSERQSRAADVLAMVALTPEYLHAYPNELSGGLAQRIAIARALLGDPKILVCDEAVSALDKGVQAQVLNVLSDLQRERRLSIVFVSHDLAVVEHMSDEITVLRSGRVVESGPTLDILRDPADPYTAELLAARHATSPA